MIETQDHNPGFAFAAIAKDYGDFPAYLSEQVTLTFEDFWRLVFAFAERMKELGVGQNSIVALNTSQKLVSIAVVLATALLGARFVPAERVLAKRKPLHPTHFLKTAEATGASAVPFIDIDEGWMPDAGLPGRPSADRFAGYSAADAPWMLLRTSGGAGAPKYLNLSQRMIFERAKAAEPDFQFAGTTAVLLHENTTLPFFVRALAAFLHVGTVVDSDDPAFWRQCGVNLVCASPMQAASLVEDIASPSSFPRIEVSGGKVPEALARELLGVFKELHDVYETSETGKAFTNVLALDGGGAIARHPQPVASVEVEIADGSGECIGPYRTGQLRIRSDHLVASYFDGAPQNGEYFRNEWFYPGDICSWDGNRALVVHSRSDDRLSVGRHSIDAFVVDATMKMVPGVKDAVAFQTPSRGGQDDILAFIEFDTAADRGEVALALREACQERLGMLFAPKRFLPIVAVPRREDGQPHRKLCEQIFMNTSPDLA